MLLEKQQEAQLYEVLLLE